jgi:hypothetical protein
MKCIRVLVAVLALALIVLFVSGEAGQTQGPVSSEPPAVQSGTAEGTSGALIEGSSQQVEVEPRAVEAYNASIRIPVAALKPRESNVEWGAGGEGGCAYAVSGDRYTWWVAPLYLPQGSILRYFRMYYNDQDTEINCAAYLTVYDLYGNIVTEWGIFSSSTGQNYATTTELDLEIDYDSYSYVIQWSPNVIGSAMQVCGFRVFYEYTWGLAFLPNVQRGE